MTFQFDKQRLTTMAEMNIRTALMIIGVNLVAEIRASMVGGFGKVYKKKGVEHRASAPGQPPSPETARLQDSIMYTTTFGDKSEVGSKAQIGDGLDDVTKENDEHFVTVGTNVPYALALEKGAKVKYSRKAGILPRPYLWPALKKSSEMIKAAFKRV